MARFLATLGMTRRLMTSHHFVWGDKMETFARGLIDITISTGIIPILSPQYPQIPFAQ